MNNPNGPYPGRQIFMGLTSAGNPCFAYLVTGRSPESRERKAVKVTNTVRIGPKTDAPYDPLRHYSAVKYENKSGIAAISNGIQTEAIFEMYRLLVNTAALAGKDYLEKIMEGAGAEPDSYHTPRIAGVITAQGENATPVFIMGMKGYGQPARTFRIEFRPGTMLCISTYKGDMDKPEARDPRIALPEVDWSGKTAEELADFVFEMSAASYQGKDIRVCVVSGVLSGSKTWKLAIK